VCNGELAPVAKSEVLDRLEPKTRLYYEVFYRCGDCQKIYWEGSCVENMRRRCAGFLSTHGGSGDVSVTPFRTSAT
jgi:uncharacterized protein with PIN domain